MWQWFLLFISLSDHLLELLVSETSFMAPSKAAPFVTIQFTFQLNRMVAGVTGPHGRLVL